MVLTLYPVLPVTKSCRVSSLIFFSVFILLPVPLPLPFWAGVSVTRMTAGVSQLVSWPAVSPPFNLFSVLYWNDFSKMQSDPVTVLLKILGWLQVTWWYLGPQDTGSLP